MAPTSTPLINAHASTSMSTSRTSHDQPLSSASIPPLPPLHPDDEEEIQTLLEKGDPDKEEGLNSDDDDEDGEEEGDELTMANTTLPALKAQASAIPNGKTGSGWGSVTTRGKRRALIKEMILQTFPVLLLCMATALIVGTLLGKMQMWSVFIRIEELFILVPILLNLKGNLEMNLAARFSTSANIGELDLRPTRRALILGNLALLQVQALIVSLISGLLAFILGILSRRGVHHNLQHPTHKLGAAEELRGGYFEALLVLCVSMLAASLSSAVLGSFMCSLVVLCRRFRINPDNLATPLASAFGDMITLVLLGGLASLFAIFMGTLISTAVFLLLLLAVCINVVITFRNAYVQELLTVGWAPLFIAMAISSGTGVVLETYVNQFEGFALFSPVFAAISGAAGSIYVSRISTALHTSTRESYTIVGSALFVFAVPVILLLLPFAWVTGQVDHMSWFFIACFIGATVIQMILALVLAYLMATILWKLDYDPDVYALPLLSALLDATGQLCLVAAFSLAGGTGGVPNVVGKVVGGDLGEKVGEGVDEFIRRVVLAA